MRCCTWHFYLPTVVWGVFFTRSFYFLAAADVARATTASTVINNNRECNAVSSGIIPSNFDAPFGSYPNCLGISQADRETFHPVIVYPKYVKTLTVGDHRTSQGMATLQQIQQAKRMAVLRCIGRWTRCFAVKLVTIASSLGRMQLHRMLPPLNRYAIGKYDENRVGMYDSDLFDNLDNTIDGYGGRRTVHLGIDLSAPVGTPVHAFANGVVHSVGYNPDHGDYGYVIVIEHHLQLSSSFHNNNNNNNNQNTTTTTRRVWALYGHLDKSTVQRKESSRPGLPIRKGQVIGRLGDIYENGGWLAPHVHFQLSIKPPDQPHDMPGASSVEDRPTALLQYPDPRYVLGQLY